MFTSKTKPLSKLALSFGRRTLPSVLESKWILNIDPFQDESIPDLLHAKSIFKEAKLLVESGKLEESLEKAKAASSVARKVRAKDDMDMPVLNVRRRFFNLEYEIEQAIEKREALEGRNIMSI